MAQRECTRCRGTGWANAARDSGMEDAPRMFRPFGVYQCTTCGGSGKLGLSDEALKAFAKALRDELDTKSSNAGIHRAAEGRPVE